MWLIRVLVQNALCFLSALNSLATQGSTTISAAFQIADHTAQHLVFRLVHVASTVASLPMKPAHFSEPIATLPATDETVAHILNTAIEAAKSNLTTCTDLIVHPFANIPPPVLENFPKVVYSYAAEDLHDWPLIVTVFVFFVVWWTYNTYTQKTRAEGLSVDDLTIEAILGTTYDPLCAVDVVDPGLPQPWLSADVPYSTPLPTLAASTIEAMAEAHDNVVKHGSINEHMPLEPIEALSPQAIFEKQEEDTPSQVSRAASPASHIDCQPKTAGPTATPEEAWVAEMTRWFTAPSDQGSGKCDWRKVDDTKKETAVTAASDALEEILEDEEVQETPIPTEEAIGPVQVNQEKSETTAAAIPANDVAASDSARIDLEDDVSGASQPELWAAAGSGTWYGEEHEETYSEADFELGRDEEDMTSDEESINYEPEKMKEDEEEEDDDDEVFIYPGAAEVNTDAQELPAADGDNHAGPLASAGLKSGPTITSATPFAFNTAAREFVPAALGKHIARAEATMIPTPATAYESMPIPTTTSTLTLTDGRVGSSRNPEDKVPEPGPRLSLRAEGKQPERKASRTTDEQRPLGSWGSIWAPKDRMPAHLRALEPAIPAPPLAAGPSPSSPGAEDPVPPATTTSQAPTPATPTTPALTESTLATTSSDSEGEVSSSGVHQSSRATGKEPEKDTPRTPDVTTALASASEAIESSQRQTKAMIAVFDKFVIPRTGRRPTADSMGARPRNPDAGATPRSSESRPASRTSANTEHRNAGYGAPGGSSQQGDVRTSDRDGGRGQSRGRGGTGGNNGRGGRGQRGRRPRRSSFWDD